MKASKITGLLLLALTIIMPVGCSNKTSEDQKSLSSSVSDSVSNQNASSGDKDVSKSENSVKNEDASRRDDSGNDSVVSKTEDSVKDENDSKTEASEEADEHDPANVMYEGLFLDNELIDSYFKQVRGDAPFGNITKDFHVTTVFFPEEDARTLYGKEIEVHIIGYKAAEVNTETGGTTSNEGFKVELKTDDSEMTAYLEKNDRNFHITGAFMDNPGYTVDIDFSDAQPLDYTVKGIFGAYLDNDTIVLSKDDADKYL